MTAAERIALCETPILDAIVMYFMAAIMCGVLVYLAVMFVYGVSQIIRPTERLWVPPPAPSSPYGGYRRG